MKLDKINQIINGYWDYNSLNMQIKKFWQEIQLLKNKIEQENYGLKIVFENLDRNNHKLQSGHNIASFIAKNGAEMNKCDYINSQILYDKNLDIDEYFEKTRI